MSYDRRALKPIQMSAAEIAARVLPFSKDELVINTDTGEVRVGEGRWDDLKSYNGQEAVTLTVRVATTANVTIATALVTGQTIDGVELEVDDVVLVKSQSAPAQNGIYVVSAAPERSTSYDAIPAFHDILVGVGEGTVNANKTFRSTTAATGTIDTDAVTFAPVVQGTLRFARVGQLATLPAKTAYTATDVVMLEQADGSLVKMALSDFKTNMA